MLDNRKYIFKSHYKDNSIIRNSFNALTEKTYGFNFKKWYEDGYWGDKYIPYSLLYEDKVVSNVSVNIMDFIVLGEPKRYIQIGTVMTDKDYREQGLCRELINRVIREWDDKCDLIYLFANSSVLEFYPKFGFEKCNEYQYSVVREKENTLEKIIKMNMNNKSDREFVYNIVCNSMPFSKISMRNNPSLIMFYCTYFMEDSICYIKDYDAIVICDFNEDVLYIQDVFSSKKVRLDTIINAMMNEKTKKVVLGFTPNDSSFYEKSLIIDQDTSLFIRKGKDNPFKIEDLMFPELSHT